MALREVTWRMVAWCTQNAPRLQQFHVAPHPCQRCKYAASVDIQKPRYENLFTHVVLDAGAVSARERRIALYQSDQQQIKLYKSKAGAFVDSDRVFDLPCAHNRRPAVQGSVAFVSVASGVFLLTKKKEKKEKKRLCIKQQHQHPLYVMSNRNKYVKYDSYYKGGEFHGKTQIEA